MDDVYIGASIVLITSITTLIVSETLRYFYSVRVEREKSELKQKDDARNFRLNSINEMKEELIKLRIALSNRCTEDLPLVKPFKQSDFIEILRGLTKLKSNFFTFSETKDLGLSMHELVGELFDFDEAIGAVTDFNKIEETVKKLNEKIEILLEISL